jgi:hypothetical protein
MSPSRGTTGKERSRQSSASRKTPNNGYEPKKITMALKVIRNYKFMPRNSPRQ